MGFFNTDHKNLIFVPAVDPLAVKKTFAADPYNHHHRTLTHAMRMFGEKNRHPAIPVGHIKANGAIVVHRSKPSFHLQHDESDDADDDNHNHNDNDNDDDDGDGDGDGDEQAYAQKKKEQQDIMAEEEGYYTTTTTTTTPESSISDNNAMHLVHEENHRLRLQISIEREYNEKYRLAKDQYEQDLVFSKQRIKELERTADRFQKLLSADLMMTTAADPKKSQRRQSTGTCFRDMPLPSTSPNTTMTVSYEHKIQILLNELEAIELDEMESTRHRTLQKKECDTLIRKLKLKEEMIRQLAYDLQFEKSLH